MKTNVSSKIHKVISMIHNAFMKPKDSGNARKQAWINTWSEIKTLSPIELNELSEGLETTVDTLTKLNSKIKMLSIKKQKEIETTNSKKVEDENKWEDNEFLDSSADLPVFKKSAQTKWVSVKPIEKPKTIMQTCQAIWVTVTNRAIYIVDNKGDKKPGPKRDLMIEKHRLAVLPAILDDKTVTDVITGKPIMNLYFVNKEVKENLLWLLAERSKVNANFRKLYIRFLRKEVIKKAKLYEWAKKFSLQAEKILKELSYY
ncbi:hypothetical protein [Candidatus Uabimicrobium amorphum]|uniref:Uncharacterized protein n=1 Tax=Uabimicrobium amorphum TaxID=2596890 RepID=A0A5S9IQ65_UABAM|nr:hypothetical protein [Candidatus Uabimicrobium amorphum]BBM85606.1 hypothetical protein UABAM_03980 [Candidatus Uabimicrobium amorphum]